MQKDDEYRVDVVVPFADRLQNLEPLESWLSAESLPKNFRVIFVHDVKNHDNATEEVINLLSKLDADSFIYIKGKYGSPGAARNAGLENVTAEWVCFWDSDDLPLPREFLKMIENGVRSQSQICVGKFEIRQHQNKLQKNPSRGNSRVSVAMTPGFWRMAFTRQSIGDVHFSNSRMGEDQLFLMAINFANLRWYRHNAVVYRYLVGVDSQLTNAEANYTDLLETFDNSIQFCDSKTRFRTAYIYSIMQIRMAVTICLKFPFEKSRKTLLKYFGRSSKHPKNLVFATIPAYITVVFSYILTMIHLAKLKLRGRSDQL